MLCFNSFGQNFVKDADTSEDLEATFEKIFYCLKLEHMKILYIYNLKWLYKYIGLKDTQVHRVHIQG